SHRLEIRGQRFAHREVRRPWIKVAGIEAVRIAGLGEEPPGLRRIVRVGLEEAGELEGTGDERARGPREAERLGLVERLAVDGQARGLANAPIVPGRFRIPLIWKVDPEGSGPLLRRHQLEPWRALDVLGHRASQKIRDVDLTLLERGRARRL